MFVCQWNLKTKLQTQKLFQIKICSKEVFFYFFEIRIWPIRAPLSNAGWPETTMTLYHYLSPNISW